MNNRDSDRNPNIDPNELVPIHSTLDAGEAEVLRVALAEEGIICRIENERQAGFTGVFPMRLFVRAEDADRATKLLKEHGDE